jgi:two-component system nitrate/nitrite response regulator NarL
MSLPPPPSPSDLRILLVEDNPAFESLIGRVVDRMRPTPALACCRTGSGALAWLADSRNRLDLALIDLGLPDMSGVDVIRAIRQRFEDVPILVVSVMSSERNVLEAIRAGARGYVLKDDTEETLAHAIGQVLQGNYPITPALARHLFRLAESGSTGGQDEATGLSPKEIELLRLIARGCSYAEASERMGIAVSTVQFHIRNLYRKLEVNTRLQAVAKARDHGLL